MKRVFLELTEYSITFTSTTYLGRKRYDREKVAINMTRVQEMRPYQFQDMEGIEVRATELRMNIPDYAIIVEESIPNIMLRLETLNGDESHPHLIMGRKNSG